MSKILVCSGPPFDRKDDTLLAERVNSYEGTTLVCGGTTALIVARELSRDITVRFKRDCALLPPSSTMEGIDLVTEGVLTLGKVKEMLDDMNDESEITQKDAASTIVKMLLEHDRIDFLVGTRVSSIYLDPDFPVVLEKRQDLITAMAGILETKFNKEVHIEYM